VRQDADGDGPHDAPGQPRGQPNAHLLPVRASGFGVPGPLGGVPSPHPAPKHPTLSAHRPSSTILPEKTSDRPDQRSSLASTAQTSRSRASGVPLFQITSCARAAFSLTGIWADRRARDSCSVMPRNRVIRSIWMSSSAATHRVKSQSAVHPDSNNRGTTANRRQGQEPLSAAQIENRSLTNGCRIASNRCSAAGSPNAIAANFRRSIPPSAARIPAPKHATISSTAAPPGDSQACTTSSASKTSHPASRNNLATRLFPQAIPPVMT